MSNNGQPFALELINNFEKTVLLPLKTKLKRQITVNISLIRQLEVSYGKRLSAIVKSTEIDNIWPQNNKMICELMTHFMASPGDQRVINQPIIQINNNQIRCQQILETLIEKQISLYSILIKFLNGMLL